MNNRAESKKEPQENVENRTKEQQQEDKFRWKSFNEQLAENVEQAVNLSEEMRKNQDKQAQY